MTNLLKKLLQEKKPVFGAQLRFGSAAIAELFAVAGFDCIILDGEHAPQSPEGIQHQLQAAACTQTTAIVRLGKNDPDLIRLYLDMGAMGVLLPFINTAEDAKLGVSACRYPPRGIRGWGPARASRYGFDSQNFAERSNEQIMFIPMIETAEAIENIDSILAVDGIDTFILGPVDLTISLGIPFEFKNPEFIAAVDKVLKAAKRAGVSPGGAVYEDFFEKASIERQIQLGFQFLLVGGDEWILAHGCKQLLNNISNFRK